MIGAFKNQRLYIELRPHCPKCKKEFMLELKNYLPGKTHSCHICGTITQFDSQIAGKIQQLIYDLETSIDEAHKSLSSARTD